MKKELVKTSRFLSLVLRHKPEAVGLELDPEGWVEVDRLLDALNRHKKAITRKLLEEVVRTNDKKRFAFSEDGLRIRASQGHSLTVDLALEPQEPPEFLYHGTVEKFLDSIKKQGLIRRQRQHVHLSQNQKTATIVGKRRGAPIILTIAARKMWQEGHAFYLSANGVWLTDNVPVRYLKFPDPSDSK